MEQEIRKYLDERPENVITALLALTPLQVSSNEDKLINDIADFFNKRSMLSIKQLQLVRSVLKRRASQLVQIGFQPEVKEYKGVSKQFSAPVAPIEVQRIIRQAVKIDQFTMELSFTYDQELIEQIKKIPGRKFLPDKKKWIVPLTIQNIQKLNGLSFTLDAEILKFQQDYRQNEIASEEIKIQKLDNILHPFQKTGVAFVESKKGRALIADDMGLGKSLQSIAWIEFNKNKDIYPIILVCPAAVKLNWKNEFKKFVGREDIELLSGRTPYSTTEKILVINYDILEAWEKELMSLRPKTIIADEIHKCKGDSKRQKALTRMSKKVNNFIGLTGTPIMNRPIELLYPVRMINPHVFPSIKAFKYRYCAPKFNGFAMEFKGASNTVELNQILTRNVMIRRKKEDVLLELPDKTMGLIPLEITNRDDYKFALDDLIAFLKTVSEEKAIKAARAKAIVKMNTLKQLAVEGKLTQCVSWIKDFLENEDEKLIVFVHHKKTVDLLMNEFGNIAVKYVGGMTDKQRKDAESDFWNKQHIKLFIGNIEAAGTGINLQVASNVAFIEYPWSPGLYGQACDRSHRMGQKNAVNIWNLVATDTIEESIITMLEQKSKVINQIIDGDDSTGNGLFNELIKSFYSTGGFK